jgi:hypothetical protein
MGPQGPGWRGALCFLRQLLIKETQMKKLKIAIVVVLLLAALGLGVMVWMQRPAIALRGTWKESGASPNTLEFYKDGTLVKGDGKKNSSTTYKLLDSETMQIGTQVYKFEIQDNTLYFTSGEWKYRKFIKQDGGDWFSKIQKLKI